MVVSTGITERCIHDTPIAIVDFETTGLTAGFDRVIEVSVVRLDPGEEPHLVLDTLVNPLRPVAATEIHGITDADVAKAPRFQDIAGDLLDVLSDCPVAAYNVYFDIKFLTFELEQAGVHHEPPHFCLMYMRPMLGLGPRCKLDEACRSLDIDHQATHIAAEDAQASARLLKRYLGLLVDRNVSTFGELGKLKSYKFVKSFRNDPLPEPSAFGLRPSNRLWSRIGHVPVAPVDPVRKAIREYWDALKTVVVDLEITAAEMEYIANERKRLGLQKEQIRFLHARAFASAITQFVDDEWLDGREVLKLRRLHRCLSKLGWAPGD